MKTEIIFFKKWLKENKKTLKVLLFITCNINKDNICICNINDICNWLDIKTSSVNKKNIKEILKELQQKNFIDFTEIKNNKYNITITDIEAGTEEEIKGIYKQWVLEVRQTKINNKNNEEEKTISVDYTISIKILIHCFIGNLKGIMTQEEIGTKIDVSKDSICDAIKILKLCNFESISFLSETAKDDVKIYNQAINQYEWKRKNIGTQLYIGLEFK